MMDDYRRDHQIFQHQAVRALTFCVKPRDAKRYDCMEYLEAWYETNFIGFIMVYDHASYPYFFDTRLGAHCSGRDYTATESAKAVLQYLFDRPHELRIHGGE